MSRFSASWKLRYNKQSCRHPDRMTLQRSLFRREDRSSTFSRRNLRSKPSVTSVQPRFDFLKASSTFSETISPAATWLAVGGFQKYLASQMLIQTYSQVVSLRNFSGNLQIFKSDLTTEFSINRYAAQRRKQTRN